MLTCHNLTLEYTPGHRVLNNVSFSIPAGAFYFLTGASGAGKSSLLNILSLAMRPSSGKLEMLGQEVTTMPREELPALRRKIGMVYQDYKLLNHLSVAENISLPLRMEAEEQPAIDAKVEELLDWVGLRQYQHHKPVTLSGGEKQRVAIARAVINNPPLLIADEPSGNLDPKLAKKFMYLFESLNKMGTTILFATHDVELIRNFHHPMLMLREGRLTEINS